MKKPNYRVLAPITIHVDKKPVTCRPGDKIDLDYKQAQWFLSRGAIEPIT